MVIILVAGLFLRIYNIGGESLWLDEGHSVRMAKLPVSRMVTEIAANKHPPAYFIALHGWINLFGDSEFAVRSLSALFGVLAMFLLYQVTALIFDRQTALLAALLRSLSSFNLFYSQETRMYSLLTFLSLGSMYFYIKMLFGGKRWNFVGYLVFSTLLIYTQNFGFFIILAQNIYLIFLLLLRRSRSETPWKSWIILQGILLLFYLPWLGVLINQILSINSGSWRVPRPTLPGLLYSFKCFSGSFWLLGLSLPLVLYSLLPRTGRGERRKADPDQARVIAGPGFGMRYLPAIWLLSLVLIPFLVSQFTSSIYVHRATVLATLPWYILVARGLSKIRHKYLGSVIVAVIIGLSLFSMKDYFFVDQKDQWREAVEYINLRADTGDMIYVYGGSPLENVFDYYYEKSCLSSKQIAVREMLFIGFSAEDVSAAGREFDRVWVILSHIRNSELSRIRKLLEVDYHLVETKRYFNFAQDQFHRDRLGLIVFLFIRKDRGEERGGGNIRELISSIPVQSLVEKTYSRTCR